MQGNSHSHNFFDSYTFEFQERNSVLIGLWSLVGYKQDFIKIDKQFTGNTTFTLRKKIYLVVDPITIA